MKRPDRKATPKYVKELEAYCNYIESQLKEVEEENEKLKKKLERRRTKRIVGRTNYLK